MNDPGKARTDPGHDDWMWTAAKLLALITAAVATVLLLWQVTTVLLMLFAAVLLAVLLRAAATPLRRFARVPERAAVILAAVLIILLVAGFIVLTGAQIRAQAASLLDSLPGLVDAAESRLGVDGLGRALGLWLMGQLAAMAMVGALTTLGLWLLGVLSALALGLIAGLLEFVPLVGPIAAAVPAVLVALGVGVDTALWTVGLYVLIQQLEGVLIVPLVQQRTVDLPPVVTIFAIIAFGTLFGALGLLLATPLAVVCLVLIKKLWVRDVLQDDVAVPGEADPP